MVLLAAQHGKSASKLFTQDSQGRFVREAEEIATSSRFAGLPTMTIFLLFPASKTPHGRLSEEGFDEFSGIECLQIVDSLTNPHPFDRHAKPLPDGEHDATLGRTVQLG